jgi:phage major head subunit gpT-like protein
MIINSTTLDALFTGFKAAFSKGFESATSYYGDVSMTVTSQTREETYGWLANSGGPITEWIGPRVITNLSAAGYTIKNADFQKAVSVPRNDIADDRVGVYAPFFEMLGQQTAAFPDTKVFSLLGNGFTAACYDGQPFFDADHPVGIPGGDGIVSVSNVQAGSGPAWFLLDCSRPLKPLIYQERQKFSLVKKDDPRDDNVFFNKEYIYGVDGRCNVGFGLWQLAFASKEALDTTNYEAARVVMQSMKNDDGTPLAIKPTHLVVPPALEGNGRRLLKALNPDGGTNEWADSTKLIVTPWLL